MIYSYLLTLLAGVVDSLLAFIIKADYSFVLFNAFPEALIIVVVLCSLDLETKKAFNYTIVVSFLASFFYPNNIWLFIISTTIAMYVVRIVSINISNSLLEEVLICLLAIFIKELITYLVYYLNHTTILSLFNWFKKNMLLTLFINIPISIVFIFLNRYRKSLIDSIELKRRKNESLFNR